MEIKGFQETTLMDWDGVVASIIFVGGCNFRCLYCHNYNLAFGSNNLESIPEEVVFQRLRELKKWIEGVIISGGEPTIYGERLEGFLIKLKKEGFKTKIYTNGSHPSLLSRLIDNKLIDAVSMDLKHVFPLYKSVIMTDSKDIIESVRNSVKILKNSCDLQVKFRLTVVKGIHSIHNIKDVRQIVYPKQLILQNVSTEHIDERYRDKVLPFTASEFEELQKSIV